MPPTATSILLATTMRRDTENQNIGPGKRSDDSKAKRSKERSRSGMKSSGADTNDTLGGKNGIIIGGLS